MKLLRLASYPGAVIHAPGDTIVVPIPADERPLRGDAGWIDWRLDGRISIQLQAGFARGARDEVVLLPATRPLRSSRVLLVGLGPARRLEARDVLRAFCTAAEKLLAMRTRLALVALPGALDAHDVVELLVRGCVQALSATHRPASLRVVTPAASVPEGTLESALVATAAEAEARRVRLELEHLPPESGAAEARSRAPRSGPIPPSPMG